jgi:hypothetical protein
MTERTLQDEIEILSMCEPIRDHQGGIWMGRNEQIADATFVDYGACRAFARAARELPKLVSRIEVLEKALREIKQAYVDAPGWAAPTPTSELVWKMYSIALAAIPAIPSADRE